MRQRLTKSPEPSQGEVEKRELEGDPEAAPEISRYLALADAALRPKRPFLLKRTQRAENEIAARPRRAA